MLIRHLKWFAVVTAASLAFVTTAAKASVTFSGTTLGNDPGETNSASVTFALSISGSVTNLVVTLANTSTYTPNDNPDILTAVFFTLAGNPTLTRISGELAAGSVGVENGTNLTIAGGDIGGSWTYRSGLSGAPGGADRGISSAGFNLFGPSDVFPGFSLPDDNPVPDGIGGGLTTMVDGGTSDGLNGRPLIQYSAVFTLGDVPAILQLSDISNVSFQYGTALSEGTILIPEPSTVFLVLAGVLGLLAHRRRW